MGVREELDTSTRYLYARGSCGADRSEVVLRRKTQADRSSIRIVPSTMDDRGNGAALNKLMTTRYPASAVLMELAAYSKKMGLRASGEWSPQEANREADDALANGDFSLFTPELQIPVCSQRFQWTILVQALDHGRVAEEAHRTAKLVGLPERKRRRRRRLEERLKMVDPW